jgi:hypothetical protein
MPPTHGHNTTPTMPNNSKDNHKQQTPPLRSSPQQRRQQPPPNNTSLAGNSRRLQSPTLPQHLSGLRQSLQEEPRKQRHQQRRPGPESRMEGVIPSPPRTLEPAHPTQHIPSIKLLKVHMILNQDHRLVRSQRRKSKKFQIRQRTIQHIPQRRIDIQLILPWERNRTNKRTDPLHLPRSRSRP